MYETGLGVAFLAWLGFMVRLVVSINSTMEKNLNRLGQRQSWLTLKPTPMEADDLHRSWLYKVGKFSLIGLISLPFTLFSWVYVLWMVGQFLYLRMRDSGVPQSVKEYRWKLRNCNMTLDQLIREAIKVQELDPASFDQLKADLRQEMADRGLVNAA
jgi:hypothetical protein